MFRLLAMFSRPYFSILNLGAGCEMCTLGFLVSEYQSLIYVSERNLMGEFPEFSIKNIAGAFCKNFNELHTFTFLTMNET